MLTPIFCIDWIKKRLGVPYTPFELEDSDLAFWLQYTVSEFSRYSPRKTIVLLDVEQCKTDEENVFVIPIADKIFSVLNVYTRFMNILVSGHPFAVFPRYSWQHLEDFILSSDLAANAYKFSSLNFTFEFLPPNKIRITGDVALKKVEQYVVELEIEHASDLSTIQPEFETIFLKMFQRNVLKEISSIRMSYKTFSTPFGEIELNPEYIEEQIAKLDEEIKEFIDNINPGIIVVRG